MSSVIGTSKAAAYPVSRTDRQGRPISLEERQPEKNSVVFTGAPGMGKSLELDRAEAMARQNGWICIRVDAPTTEPLEIRFARAVNEKLDGLRDRYGLLHLRQLKKTVKNLTPRRNQQHGAEIRAGVGIATFIAKTQWDAAGNGSIGSTLSQLADNLAELAARKGDAVLLMVDNLPAPPRSVGMDLSPEEMAAERNLGVLA